MSSFLQKKRKQAEDLEIWPTYRENEILNLIGKDFEPTILNTLKKTKETIDKGLKETWRMMYN